MKEEQSQVCTYNGSVGTSLWLHYRNPLTREALQPRKQTGMARIINPSLSASCRAAPGAVKHCFRNQEDTGGGPQGFRVTYRASLRSHK